MASEAALGSIVQNIGNQVAHLPVAEAIIFDIAIILTLSAIFAFIAKVLRQPLIPAYVLTGLVIGPAALGWIKNMDLIMAFSEIGIAFLLFTAGLEISFRKINEVSLKKMIFVGFVQVSVIFGIALLMQSVLGLSALQAAYIGIIMAFSSTMVDIKLLADRGEIVTIHGRLVLGILLLQDLIAIIAIIMFTSGGFAIMPILSAFMKLIVLITVALVLQRYVLSKLFKFAARSSELLFLSSLAVLFFFIILAYLSELSIIIGAFIAGVSLANSRFKTELESRVAPLRDFFAILFFVALGMQLVFSGIAQWGLLLITLIAVALAVKPLLLFVLLRISSYQPRTSFLTSVSLAQLSEFSLIIGIIGVTLGALDASIFSTVVLATIITMSLTPYLITYKDRMYRFFKTPADALSFLPIQEKIGNVQEGKKEIVLIGAHRIGSVLLENFMKKKKKLLVIDYNPEIVNNLVKNDVSCVYGDISSPELLSKIDFNHINLVVSTIPHFEESVFLIEKIKEINPGVRIVVTGGRISESLALYEKGADYVIMPKILAGEEISDILKSENPRFKVARDKHLKKIKEIHKLLY